MKKKKRKRIKQHKRLIVESELKDIYVPCWNIDDPKFDYYKDEITKLWRSSKEDIRKFFKGRKKVHFKFSPLLACIYRSKSRKPQYEDCFGCTKFQKFLPWNQPKPKVRKKIKVKKKSRNKIL